MASTHFATISKNLFISFRISLLTQPNINEFGLGSLILCSHQTGFMDQICPLCFDVDRICSYTHVKGLLINYMRQANSHVVGASAKLYFVSLLQHYGKARTDGCTANRLAQNKNIEMK